MSFYAKKRISHEVTTIYIIATFFLATVLTLLFAPWHIYLPNFLLLVITWWTIRAPKVISFILVALLGLFYDIICDRVMGVTMAQFIIVMYFVFTIRYRLQLYTFIQQTVTMLITFSLAFAIPYNLANIFVGQPQNLLIYWSPLFSGIIWVPFVLIIVFPQYRPIKEETATHQSL